MKTIDGKIIHWIVRTSVYEMVLESQRYLSQSEAKRCFQRMAKPGGGRKVLVKVTRRRIEKPTKTKPVKAVAEAAE